MPVLSDQISINSGVIGGGGGVSVGGPPSVSGTVGEPGAGSPMQGTSFTIRPGFWNIVAARPVPIQVPVRTVWQIGVDNDPSVLPYRPTAEFSIENSRNDAPPGKVTRRVGDPQYVAGTNPTADDDFYFQGGYPAGFNGLLSALAVPNDEPPAAWERAHTTSDTTNRVHFILDASQVTAQASFRLSLELVFGGTSIGGTVQPGFAEHDIVVRYRNSVGAATQLFTGRVTRSTNMVIPFAASGVGATAGANTLEIVRTGPSVAGVSYWIQYDYLRLESRPLANTPPVFVAPVNREVDELSILSFGLGASDSDLPAQALAYSLVSGPVGLTVSGEGSVSWIPTEAQGPGVYTVVVRVTDNGLPALSDTRSFTVVVHEMPDTTARTEWQIGTDNVPSVLPYRPTAEFSIENSRNDAPPGKVTRRVGDPQYVAGTNPTADDDFYFQGRYPVGFNGLSSPLAVPNDEPPAAWERAHTAGDTTNRVHFILDSSQVTAQSSFRLSFELVFGGTSIGGVVQPGFAEHDIVVRFRNSVGAATQLFSQRISRDTNIVIPFAASGVGATAGANTLEIVRTGPSVAGVYYWIQYDYLRLQSLPAAGVAASSPRAPLRASAASPTAPGVVRTEILRVDGLDFLAITFDVSGRSPSGQGYTIEVSDDLEHWSPYRIEASDRVQSGPNQSPSVQVLLPLGEVGMRFLRLRFP
ncbi:MAG: hypothetical protein RIS76_2487 [Verrucomicrobiota bacterium]